MSITLYQRQLKISHLDCAKAPELRDRKGYCIGLYYTLYDLSTAGAFAQVQM